MNLSKIRRRIFAVTAVILSSCLLLFFQNCSKGFTINEDVMSSQAFIDYTNQLDSLYLSKLTTATNISYWQVDASVDVDNTPAFASGWSVVAVVTDTTDGGLFSVDSGAGTEESILNIVSGSVRINQIGDLSNFTVKQFPAKTFNSPSIIAFSSGSKVTGSMVLVDGYLQKATAQNTGASLDFSLLAKNLNFDSNRIKEIIFYPRSLSGAELIVISRYMGRKYNLSTVALDPSVLDADNSTTVETDEAKAAFAVINSRCLSCHSSSNNGDFRALTTSKAIQKQLISPGNLANSKLYYRLSGSQVGPGPRDMPDDGAIPLSEVQAIEAWILSLQ